MTATRKKSHRFGLLCNEVGSLYQAQLWNAFLDAVRARHGQAVGVFGRTWGSPVDNEAVANEVYRFLGALGIEGSVVPGALLSTHQPITRLPEVAGLDDASSVYLGARIHGGQRLVHIDPAPAIQAGIRHLHELHGCRKIACVTGHYSNPETGERLQAYRKALRELGLTWDPTLEEPGDFNTEGGGAAARELLERHPDLQAIFFMSDNMAIGAWQALREDGIPAEKIPYFLGFDDIEAARVCERPLTTIRQPTEAMVRRAVDRLLPRQSQGLEDVEVLPAELVVRCSCGCHECNVAGDEELNRHYSANLDFLFLSRRVRRSAQALFADLDPASWHERLGTSLERMDIPWACFLEWKSSEPLPVGDLSAQTFHRFLEFRASDKKPRVVDKPNGRILSEALDEHRGPVLAFPLVCENQFLGLAIMPHVARLELSYDPYILQLAAALHGSWLLEAQKQAEVKLLRLNKRLQDQSHRDELTGILNRRGFYMLAEQILRDFSRAREDALAALVFIDMDGLKGINDNLGHAEGDHAIRNVATALRDTLRKNDILARMGGDEFVVFVRIKKPDEADALMQRALAHLRTLPLEDRELSFSYGVQLVRAGDHPSVNDLLVQADALLYEAKQKRHTNRLK